MVPSPYIHDVWFYSTVRNQEATANNRMLLCKLIFAQVELALVDDFNGLLTNLAGAWTANFSSPIEVTVLVLR